MCLGADGAGVGGGVVRVRVVGVEPGFGASDIFRQKQDVLSMYFARTKGEVEQVRPDLPCSSSSVFFDGHPFHRVTRVPCVEGGFRRSELVSERPTPPITWLPIETADWC